jgi:methylmalonyl-CoA mutase cobalamin-binding subunit
MGNTNSVHKISFKQMQTIIQNKDYIIINTLSNASQEVSIINNLIKTDKERIIIIYGKNCIDESLIKKYTQLLNLGFKNINVYVGGLFEWLTLQDIYGSDLFPTTSIENDFLKYSP